MNYKDAIKLLTSQGKFHIDLGLERTKQVLELIGNPQDKLKCIQVAGTNGKGSVCTMLESILRTAGFKTGLYTSPHIFEYTERIKIKNEEISQEDFANYIEEIITIADKNNIPLTEFEILTIVMFKYFADNNIDIAIIETGLGGRLDATNVLKENICSVITHIDYDHTERLGNTKEQIAYEKAGIIKPNSAVITSEGYEVIKDKADEVGALFALATPFVPQQYLDALSLKGQHQQENLALVLAVLELKYRDITDETIIKALQNVKHPCRFQYIKEKNLIIDGAHNPNGIQALRQNLDIHYPNIPKQYIFGCLKNKDYSKMIQYITSDNTIQNLFIYEFDNPNACKTEDIKNVCGYPIKKLENINDINFSNDTLTIICGSFYMLKEFDCLL
ncbi:MAG: bifunctional folylpolyglutamate synthase/dihydrofolate synthase [Candidatus Gastranaerophilales bacterium]|nr:bifunctional folylpolyglutamate synthase/dihydrofolate synthase [Candidatus Gastranaerophilales bacterium]